MRIFSPAIDTLLPIPSDALVSHKVIAYFPARPDIVWSAGIVLYLLAEIADINAEVLGLIFILRSPHIDEQLPVWDDPPTSADQIHEQL
jgi:hypothetical protein